MRQGKRVLDKSLLYSLLFRIDRLKLCLLFVITSPTRRTQPIRIVDDMVVTETADLQSLVSR